MSTPHLSETEIQQYLTEKDSCSSLQLEHMQSCEECRQMAAAYTQLFQGLQQQPDAGFDFDLEALVLDQLPKTRPAYPMILTAIAVFAIPSYCCRKALLAMITGLPVLSISLVVVPVMAILAIQCAELWKQYNKKLQQLGTHPV